MDEEQDNRQDQGGNRKRSSAKDQGGGGGRGSGADGGGGKMKKTACVGDCIRKPKAPMSEYSYVFWLLCLVGGFVFELKHFPVYLSDFSWS